MRARAKPEHVQAIYLRSRVRRPEKQRILDEFCEGAGHHRKHAIRLLTAPRLVWCGSTPTLVAWVCYHAATNLTQTRPHQGTHCSALAAKGKCPPGSDRSGSPPGATSRSSVTSPLDHRFAAAEDGSAPRAITASVLVRQRTGESKSAEGDRV
jgi:hypothetical protein